MLGLPEYATREEIRERYRELLGRWHPDRCVDDPGKRDACTQMTQKVVAAYETLMAYCDNYKYSFTREDYTRHLAGQAWWMERFGDDPLWGGAGDDE